MQQNFCHHRAVLLSADGDLGALTRPLPAALARLGLEIHHHGATAGVPALDPARDILFLDGDDDLPTLLAPLPPEQLALVPIIGLVGIEAPGRLRALMQAGATAFLRKPVYGSAVYAALFLGVNEHRIRRRADALIAAHEQRRRGRKFLVRATLRLMQRDGLDDDAAYDALRRAAMCARVSVEEYSEAWLAETEADPDRNLKRTA